MIVLTPQSIEAAAAEAEAAAPASALSAPHDFPRPLDPPLRYTPVPFTLERPARGHWWWIAGGLIFVAAVVAWHAGLKYRFIAKRWGVVAPGEVYRSGQISKWVFDRQIAAHRIAAVIDLNGIEKGDEHQAYEIRRCPELGVKHYRFALGGDGRGDIRRYAAALATIAECRRRGEPVLVHCSAGAQRTGGVVAFYRVLIEGRPPAEALREMRQYGWRPERDTDLIPYLNAHSDALAAMLVERGVIARVPDSSVRFDAP